MLQVRVLLERGRREEVVHLANEEAGLLDANEARRDQDDDDGRS
jgi:hypothetical protein